MCGLLWEYGWLGRFHQNGRAGSDLTEDGWIPCESTLWALSGELTKHRTAPPPSLVTQLHSLSLCFPFLQCPFLSLFILSFHLPLSGLRLSVPPKPPYQHVWLMKKGNVCRNSIILTCWWQRERWGVGGAGEKETEKGRKKTVPYETPLTEVQLALLWTKDVIILFKIMSEKLAIKRFITLCVTIGREALFMILLEQLLLNI